MGERLHVLYRIQCAPDQASGRALGIALEQSTELPAGAEPEAIHALGLPGRVEELVPAAWPPPDAHALPAFDARISFPTELAAGGITALANVLFGNTSMQTDVTLLDADLPAALVADYGGPRLGSEGLRRLLAIPRGPLTCTALKPVGASVAELATLAGRFAAAGIDIIKDDHGIGDQQYAPFAERMPACLAAVAEANARRGGSSLYVPHISGPLDTMRRRLDLCRRAGARAVMVAPMLVGLPAFAAIAAEAAWGSEPLVVLGHPALSGAARISPALLLGKIYRLLGADAVIFVNYGGRFGTPPAICQALAHGLRTPWGHLRPALPVPAGGMTVERVADLLQFYGPDLVLLISGALFPADEGLDARSRRFVEAVRAADAQAEFSPPAANATPEKGTP